MELSVFARNRSEMEMSRDRLMRNRYGNEMIRLDLIGDGIDVKRAERTGKRTAETCLELTR